MAMSFGQSALILRLTRLVMCWSTAPYSPKNSVDLS